MEAGCVFSALFFTSLLSLSFRRDNNHVCKKGSLLLETLFDRDIRRKSMLDGEKEEAPVVGRKKIFCDRLHAHYGRSNCRKHFAVWSPTSSSLKTDADKQVFLYTKSPVVS